MRERIAVGISILAVGVLLALSVLFAVRQNPTAGSTAITAPRSDAIGESRMPDVRQENDSVAGMRVFSASGCERCHSVAGVGSPRYPLDGVGSRRSPVELRTWTVASAAVQDSLSPSAVRAKQRYEQIPREGMRVLLVYMASLIDR
jgi:hypothetical protein